VVQWWYVQHCMVLSYSGVATCRSGLLAVWAGSMQPTRPAMCLQPVDPCGQDLRVINELRLADGPDNPLRPDTPDAIALEQNELDQRVCMNGMNVGVIRERCGCVGTVECMITVQSFVSQSLPIVVVLLHPSYSALLFSPPSFVHSSPSFVRWVHITPLTPPPCDGLSTLSLTRRTTISLRLDTGMEFIGPTGQSFGHLCPHELERRSHAHSVGVSTHPVVSFSVSLESHRGFVSSSVLCFMDPVTTTLCEVVRLNLFPFL
jgi:hypothetical protein